MAYKKRSIILGDYDTAVHGLWTLTGWEFPEPELAENLVEVPGRVLGPLDLSTALTGGEPRYKARPLSATLESSEGTREARAARISEMVNLLHGQRLQIILPDHPNHYAVGRLSVRMLYNTPAHASVEVLGTCEPWLHAMDETNVQFTATATERAATLRNSGAMPVVPLVTISGQGAAVQLRYGANSWTLSAGDYKLPALRLTPGDHVIHYSGTGTASITYREAVLR
jgi:hypothetical protein